MTENKELLTKIGKTQADIDSLVRDEKNKFQNYNYFEESQLLRILKPKLKENKLTLIISDDDTQPFQWEKQDKTHFIRYLKKLEISDQETGQALTCKFWASGDNTDLAKAKGSAETYAMKYILSKFFLIRVIDENDPELKKPENINQVENKQGMMTVAEQRKKLVKEKAILRNNAWWCKRCEENKQQENYKLCDNSPYITTEILLKELLKHGELKDLRGVIK